VPQCPIAGDANATSNTIGLPTNFHAYPAVNNGVSACEVSDISKCSCFRLCVETILAAPASVCHVVCRCQEFMFESCFVSGLFVYQLLYMYVPSAPVCRAGLIQSAALFQLRITITLPSSSPPFLSLSFFPFVFPPFRFPPFPLSSPSRTGPLKTS